MADFTLFSNYNADSEFAMVRMGGNAYLTEASLNEMQQIQLQRTRELIKTYIGDGFFSDSVGTLSMSAGVLTLANATVAANGDLLYISTLKLALASGETAYIDVYEQEVTFGSTIKKYGNQQELTTIANNILDARLGVETDRRVQVCYNMVKATGVAGHTYIPVATATGATTYTDARVKLDTGRAMSQKMSSVASGANKVETSLTNGNIKIDGVEKTVYTHPATHDDRYYTEAEMGATTAGASGAHKVGIASVTGLTGTTVYDMLVSLKSYADTLTQVEDIKDSVRTATTTNIVLAAPQTIDGIAVVAGDRVLVKNQTNGAENGIYNVQAAAWTRSTDADTSQKVTNGMYTYVCEGTANGSSGWVLNNVGTITLGTTSLNFTQFSGAAQIVANGGLAKSANTLSVADGGITDAKIGNRVADQTTATAYGSTGTLTQLLSWMAKRFKEILGTTNWYDTIPATLTTIWNKFLVATSHKHTGVDGDGAKIDYANLQNTPTSLPANGGNAATVGGKAASDFAPAGYGLGGAAQLITDWNAATNTGFYWSDTSAANIPSAGVWVGYVVKKDTNYLLQVVQLVDTTDADGLRYERRYRNATWETWRNTSVGNIANFTGTSKLTVVNALNELRLSLQSKADTMVYYTTNTGTTNTNKYTQIGSIRFTAQGQEADVMLAVSQINHARTEAVGTLLHIRAAQIASMGGFALIAMNYEGNNAAFTTANFIAVTSTNTATETIILIYAYITSTSTSYKMSIINGTMPATLTMLSNQPFIAALPAGTQTALTDKALGRAISADKLTTARLINGISFNGTSDITIKAEANGGNAATVGNVAIGDIVQASNIMRTLAACDSDPGSNPNAKPNDIVGAAMFYDQMSLKVNYQITIADVNTISGNPNTLFYLSSACTNLPVVDNFLMFCHGGMQTIFGKSGIYTRVQTNSVWGSWTAISLAGHTHTKASITDFPVLKTVATSGAYADLTGTPTSLPANGGNAATVGGKAATDFAASTHTHLTATISVATSTAGEFDKTTTAPTGTTRLNYNGYFYATKTFATTWGDLAELFEKEPSTLIEAGDIVALNSLGKYEKVTSAYDKCVVGVCSDQWGYLLGGTGDEKYDAENFAPVGLSGRVPTKIVGPIKAGDLVVSSDIAGVGMVANAYVPGTVVGKALATKTSSEVELVPMLIMNL